ncbi:hypothetical protein LP414_17715 [Polaromonas sp. P1(28)-13]|nr:hypothetical protein LP414_17715 [Polaromonas sp. P1(28)-13]
MKKLAVLLLVLTGLSGCVVYPVPYGEGRGYRHHGGASQGYYGDRDGDGVRNRNDRYPNNPRRY